MRLAYYEPKFPYPQGASAGPYPRTLSFYEPRFPFPQGASAGPYPRLLTSPGMNGLGNYRPNQGFYRGVTPGVSRTLGVDLTQLDLTDPTTLLMLIGGGFVLWNLFKGARSTKRSVKRYRRRRQARRALQAQVDSL